MRVGKEAMKCNILCELHRRRWDGGHTGEEKKFLKISALHLHVRRKAKSRSVERGPGARRPFFLLT